jgi:glycosyltransferase involved in cell wall biosynthesis
VKILYLYQYFVARQGHGMTRAYEFARRLVGMGHEVTVITSAGYLQDEYKKLKKTTLVDIEGVPTLIIPVPYSNSMSFRRRMGAFVQFALLASWACMRRRADLVYASSGPLTIAIPGMLASAWQRIPMIFEVRDLWPELPIAIGAIKNPAIKAAARALEWTAYHRARHVVALAPGMAEGVMKRGIPASRVTVIPNCADVDLFDVPESTGDPIRHKLGLTPRQPLIVYTGTFGLMNNVGFMVDVAAEMRRIAPEIRFLLVGAGGAFEKVMEKARTLGVLDENLYIWEPLPKTQMPAVLAAATIATSLFAPVREMWNNSANKFFDALAAGRPIAINYGGWQAELLTQTGAGITISDRDPCAAAQALAAFTQDEARLAAARAAARALAYDSFNRETMAARLEALMRQVAGDISP